MDCDWQVGQQVVCIDGGNAFKRSLYANFNLPEVNGIYTIRAIQLRGLVLAVLLCEVVNPPGCTEHGYVELAFATDMFRPVKETSIAVFEQILVNVPAKQTEQVS